MIKKLSIWSAFIFFVFNILAATGIIVYILSFLFGKLRVFMDLERVPYFPLLVTLCTSVLIGTFLSIIFGKKFIEPIDNLRIAMKQIAAGDFQVQVSYSKKNGEVEELIRDFNKMVKDLGSIESLRNDFAASVSHEIKTPIAAIEGCVELLKEPNLTEQERIEYTNLIALSAQRLSVLTSNILKLSKLENQEILPERKEFSLDEQIRQAILLLESKWTTKNIQLNIRLASVHFCGNQDLLMQVWTNLLDNAIKFSDENSIISVELFQDKKFIYVKFIDYGIGMNEQTMKHIYNKFYQGNKARSNQGNGLGLALVKRIIELSNGKIEVQSRLGKGSTFTVELPVYVKKSEKDK